MIFKKFKPFAGPKVFEFKSPEGRLFKGNSMQDLVTQITGYRVQNELEPIEFLEQVIENYLCQLPIHAGACTASKPLKRSIVQYLQGGIALLKNIAYNSFVDQAEADRRSDICVSCPFNEFPDQGRFIKWSNEIAEKSVGSRKSKNHDKLGICGICSCPLRAKQFYQGKVKLTPGQEAKMRAEKPDCWQLNLL